MEENNELVYDPEWESAIKFEQGIVSAREAQEQNEQQVEQAGGEQQAAQPQQQQQAQQTESKKSDGFNVGEAASDTALAAVMPVLATADLGADVARLVGLQGVDDWWDKNSPQFHNPLLKWARGVAKELVPNALLYLGTRGLIKKSPFAVNLNPATRKGVINNLLLEGAVDTAVSAVNEDTATEENLMNSVENWTGSNGLPLAVQDGDSPDAIWRKNMLLNMGFTGAFSAFAGFLGLKNVSRITKLKDGTEIVESADDIAMDALEGMPKNIEKAQTDEAIERLVKDPEGQNGYDGFINEPHEPQDRVVHGVDADPRMAVNDQARIQKGLGTTDGQQRSMLTPEMRKIFNAAPASKRADVLEGMMNQIKQIDEIKSGGYTLKAKDFDNAVDNVVDSVMRSALNGGGFDAIKKTIEDAKTSVFTITKDSSTKYIGEEEQQVFTKAAKRLLDIYFDEDQIKASAMVQQSAAGEVVTAANAVNQLDDSLDMTRVKELINEGMGLILRETRVNRAVSGTALNMKKMLATAPPGAARKKILDQAAKNFEKTVEQINVEASQIVQTYNDIAKNNPELLKPFIQVYDLTNGDVDTLAKMAIWSENKVGLVKKAVIDGKPEWSSYAVQNLRSIMYNSVLNGLAPVRAAAGAFTAIVSKPISVLAGAAVTGDTATMARALTAYGGLSETMSRAFKQLGNSWRYALRNPELAGRADTLGFEKRVDEFEILDSLAKTWEANGETAKVAWWNATKLITTFNNSPVSRLGVNAMYAIDGFTQSFVASGMARSRAYDEMFETTGGVWDENLFNKLQQAQYNRSFDADGLLTDEASKFASSEIALNLDNKMVNAITPAFKRIPVLESIFMFPRTGINALEVGWSFNPASTLGLSWGRQRKVMYAVTKEDKIAALAEHGLEYSDEAFRALKSEYIGRGIMGSAVVMGTAMAAFEGRITGNGPQDYGERQRMISMGWEPLSIKVGDKYYSYKGIEPFDTLLGLTADVVFEATRKDKAFADEWFQKISFAIAANITNKTFLSGFEPLVSGLSGDEGAINRMIANNVNKMIPYAGARNQLGRVVTPQLKDVKNDWRQYMANQNKYLFNNNDYLKDYLDVFTGEPINYTDGLTATMNNLLPFFKNNGGMEPWRQWLLSTGWDNLKEIRTDPSTGDVIAPEKRQYINNWIAQNGNLVPKIEALMNNKELNAELDEYKKQLGPFQSQNDMPVKKTGVHFELDRIFSGLIQAASTAYSRENADAAEIENLRGLRNKKIQGGRITEAQRDQQRVKELLNNPNK